MLSEAKLVGSYSMFQDLNRRLIEISFLGIWDAAQIH